MIRFNTVTSPVYANSDNSAVDCRVAITNGTQSIGNHDYTAAADDPTPHGKQLWADLIAWKYGPIAPFAGDKSIRNKAIARLSDSDRVAMRCIKAGIPYPAAWLEYDKALRAIINAGTGALPQRPAYPAGT